MSLFSRIQPVFSRASLNSNQRHDVEMLKRPNEENVAKHFFIHIPKNAGSSVRKLLESNSSTLGRQLTYVGHESPLEYFSNDSKNTITLREPVDRFVSGFFFRLHLYKTCREWAKEENITTPDQFIGYLRRTQCRWNPILSMRGDCQSVAGFPITTSVWVFQPQSLWFRRPNSILIQGKLDTEWRDFCEYHNLHYIKLPVFNKSFNSKEALASISIENKLFLRHLYSGDFALWETWGSAQINQRLGIKWG